MKGWGLGITLLLGLCSLARADFTGLDAFSYQYYQYTPQSFDLGDLTTILRRHRVRSISGLLRAFRREKPELLRFFVPVYQSHSLHRASFSRPRILLFSSPYFILAFGTDPKDPSYGKLEILTFDPATKEHDVKEVAFRPGKKPRLENSPKSCATCHGAQTKPCWDGYNFWAGTYGARESMYATSNQNSFQSAEHARFKDLLKEWKTIPRLKYLDPAVDTNSRGDYSPRLSSQFLLSVILYSQRYLHVADRLTKAPFFPYFREYFEKGISSERAGISFADVETLLPAELRAKIPFTGRQVGQWKRGHEKRVLTERLLRAYLPFPKLAPSDAERAFYFHEFIDEKPERGIDDFLFLAEAAGASTADWSLNYGRDAYLFASGVYQERDLMEGVRRALLRLPPAGTPSPLPPDYARRVSRHFEKGFTKQAEMASLDKQPVLARCQYCHTEPHLYGGNVKNAAPYIPFHDAAKMTERLSEPRFLTAIRKAVDTTMPPRPMQSLTAAERDSFHAYLDALVAP